MYGKKEMWKLSRYIADKPYDEVVGESSEGKTDVT